MTSTPSAGLTGKPHDYKIWKVITASAVGTMIEWYDFYIFGSLATVISPLFYPKGNNTLALIAYLSTFAVGFVVRPFGALFFGRIGDLVGRKYAFLVTLLIMGGATSLIGFLPTYATIGIAAPISLLVIRILQGLALGGEYGGAAVYVAEHVPDARRGFYLPRRHFTLHPPAHEGVADFPTHQERGDDFGAAFEGSVYEVGKLEARFDFAFRRHRGPGRHLVYRPVLRFVLPANCP